LITGLIRIGHFPSLSGCIILDDKVVWSKGYGFYDIENRKPATEYTTYIVASISKTITGAALMQLYDKGLFGLDDDVNEYLPFSLRNPNFPDIPITFRMLLSHSSSLNIAPDSFSWSNFSRDPPVSWYPYPWIEEYVVPGGKYYDPEVWNSEYPPEEKTDYANVNFVVCAFLVEILSHEPFIE
jgi:CubicO group peptidase (beta-lactamase class C family)